MSLALIFLGGKYFIKVSVKPLKRFYSIYQKQSLKVLFCIKLF